MDRDKNKEEMITLEMDENKIKFIQTLQKHVKMAKDSQERAYNAKDPQSKAFFALGTIVEYNHVESLHYLQFSIDSVIDLGRSLADMNSKLAQIEKELQTTQTKTSEELSSLNELIDQVKKKNLQALQKVNERLAQATKQTNIDDRQRKLEAEILDNALRSK